MERYVARRINYPICVILCLLCLCLTLAGCRGDGGEVTSGVPTDPSYDITTERPEITTETPDFTTEAPEVTTESPEVTTENTADDTTSGNTEEITTEPEVPETTEEPKPVYIPVLVYGADGESKTFSVELGKTLSADALNSIILPSDTDTVKVVFLGWEYSLEKDGERKPYDTSDPAAVTESGMHIYPVLEYSYLVSFSAGEGSFPKDSVTEFFVESGKTVKISELIVKLPSKGADKEYTYSLLGFDINGKLLNVDDELTVESVSQLTAVYGKTEIEYTVHVHTEIGELPDGGKSFVFKGNYKNAEAFIETYRNYSYKDVYFDDSVYSFKEILVIQDGREWSLELVWNCEILKYSVTLDHNDGSAPTVNYIIANGNIMLPTDPRREDKERYYDFVGWRDEYGYLYNGGYEVTVTENMTFKAEFAPGERKVYTVVFDTEIGVFENGSPAVVLQGYYGEPLTPPAPPHISELTFGEVVYKFAGWDGEVIEAFTENISYTAVYTTPHPVYHLNFYVDGELWLSLPHYESTILSAPERPEYTKGLIFSGWLDLPESMPGYDLDVHAATRPAEVIYILDGDIVSRNNAEVGSIVTLAAPAQKYGHTVSGWSTVDIDGINDSSFVMPERDVCFSAVSSPKPHTVKYILDGVTVYTDSVLFGDIYTIRGIEVRVGCLFTGWKIQDSNLNTEVGLISIPDNDIVFIGGFEICSYNVNYYLDGILLYTDTYRYGDTVTLRPDEIQEGCSFAWNTAAVNISTGSFRMPAGDIDIHGAFSDGDNKLIFIIDGEEHGTLGVRAGKTVDVSFAPSKIGYTFTGWSCVDIDVSSGKFVMPEGDVILRGSFIPNAHTVTFIDMATDVVMGMSQLDFGSPFTLGDRVYCDAGRVSVGLVLLEGDVIREGDGFIMPDSEVVFGIVWEECLTLEIEEGYWVPYYDHLEYECEGCRFDEETKTLYISDPSVKVAGSSEGITVVFDYQ